MFISPVSRGLRPFPYVISSKYYEAAMVKIQDDGVEIGSKNTLNFTGDLATPSLDEANNRINVAVAFTETDPIYSAWDKDYADLTNKPDLTHCGDFTAWDKDYDDLTNKPDLTVYEKLDGTNQPATGNKEISKADPEHRLTDTGNSEYTRVTKSDTDNAAARKNRVLVLGSTGGIDSYTVLMLHMNGTDGSTTFTDDSASAHVITAQGNAQIDTAQKKFGTASGLFDGAGDYISTPDHADFDFGTGAFTLDFWLNLSAGSRYHTILNKGYSTYYVLQTNNHATTPSMILYANGGSRITSSIPQALNTWTHYAIVRNGNIVTMYVNGVSAGSWDTAGASIDGGANPLYIGTEDVYFLYFVQGYLDELRISKGIARWTANFTPPTAEYTVPEDVPEEIAVWESKDSAVGGEKGIQTFGVSDGYTFIKGSTIDVENGATGSFTSAGTPAKTVTVVKGIITSIV